MAIMGRYLEGGKITFLWRFIGDNNQWKISKKIKQSKEMNSNRIKFYII